MDSAAPTVRTHACLQTHSYHSFPREQDVRVEGGGTVRGSTSQSQYEGGRYVFLLHIITYEDGMYLCMYVYSSVVGSWGAIMRLSVWS